MAEKAKVLVVANRTAESPELLEALRVRTVHGPCEFTLLVPQTPHGLAWAADPDAGQEEAERHRVAFLAELREEGLDVEDAKVGDGDPLAAIQDECNLNSYDELIVSTLPLRLSKWLHIDLPSKAHAATGLPVTHVVGSSS
jgi:nucleotide-binding universal stress UspA family protein